MRVTTLFNKLLDLQDLWVRAVRFEDGDLVLTARRRSNLMTCPDCGRSRRTGKFSEREREWRHLGIWGTTVRIVASIRRMRCNKCDRVVTEDVAWARPGSSFTRAFEDSVGLMAQRTDQTAVSDMFAISWKTVGNIAERLVDELLPLDRLKSLRRIGVDEISFRKRHRYLTVVTDHDTRKVVWVGEGKCSETLKGFFRSLPDDTREQIEVVTMDMSKAYQLAVREMLPNAEIAFDHFHIAKLANEALNEVRRECVRETRQADPAKAQEIKSLYWTTLYRFDNLPDKHYPGLRLLDPQQPLGAAYLLKEQLLMLLRRPKGYRGLLPQWIDRAASSGIAQFVKLANTIQIHITGIYAFMDKLVTNARAEGINNKIRLLSHRAFGFHSAAPLLSMIYLCCGGVDIPRELHML